jgi:hypothetical protein
VNESERVSGKERHMLTNADVQELTWWFGTPAPVYAAGRLAAQTYDPKSSGGYDPTTDTRLENLVQAAVTSSQSEWSRVKRILDDLTPAHRDILRRAFGPLPAHALPVRSFRYPEVAIVTPTALARAAELATHDEHVRLLEVAEHAARVAGYSPMTVAIRVLETDRHVLVRGIVVTDDMRRCSTRRLLERASKSSSASDTELLVSVKLEMQRLVDEAGDAYRRTRADLGATRRAEKAERRRAAEALLDEQLGKKRRKEAERFEARLRRAS